MLDVFARAMRSISFGVCTASSPEASGGAENDRMDVRTEDDLVDVSRMSRLSKRTATCQNAQRILRSQNH